MYPAIPLLAILLSYYTTHSHALPALPNPIPPLTSPPLPPTIPSTPPQQQQQQNTTASPSNFLGVECYHLLPDTVTLIACQPLFVRLFRHGDPYQQIPVRNGFRALTGVDPCTLTISSPDRRHDRSVKISVAAMVLFATEILETCRENETGGAYVFQENWRVVITKNPLTPTARGGLGEE